MRLEDRADICKYLWVLGRILYCFVLESLKFIKVILAVSIECSARVALPNGSFGPFTNMSE